MGGAGSRRSRSVRGLAAIAPERLARGLSGSDFYVEFGQGQKYSDYQAEDLVGKVGVLGEFDSWTARFIRHVRRKGRVRPGKYGAFGYEAPSHRWADLKLKCREIRMGVARAPKGSSPAAQQRKHLNRDATLKPKRGEGEKLREQATKP